MKASLPGRWPAFPLGHWDQTSPTLHRWMQVIGKVRLALSAPANHYWHVAFYVSAHGLTTSPIPYGTEVFECEFDFISHQLVLTTSWAPSRSIPLRSQSVADFYAQVMAALEAVGIAVHIWTTPVEMPDPIPFEQDHAHAGYDPAAAHALWRVLIQVDRVFKQFRGRFLGKASPVHFFWGAPDLAVTRFSGRPAPPYTGSAFNVSRRVMEESYSHEVSSAGFWPGDAIAPPGFYSYAVPEPPGFRDWAVQPSKAAYDTRLGEFFLPYEVVRVADQPDELLLSFLQSTYEAAANLAQWDRDHLEP